MALPGLPGHPALRPRSPVLAAVREMLGGPQTSFLLIAGQHNAQADRCLGVCRDAAKISHDTRWTLPTSGEEP